MKKNNMWLMVIGVLILVVVIFIIIIMNSADFDIITINKTTIVNDDTLVLEFSDDIILDEKTKSCFSIKDETGKEIPVSLTLDNDKKSVYVNIDEKVKGYELGDKYTLYVIKGINTEENLDLESDYCYEFEINEKKIDFILGLGNVLTDVVSNDRKYEWYIDQGATGSFARENAGTACAVMASKWFCKENNTSIVEARKNIKPSGELWNTEEIQIFLENSQVNNIVVEFTDIENMKNEIKKGNILITYIDTSVISYNSDFSVHIGRFYEYEGPHYLIIKGYKEVDEKIYFQVYDPYNFSRRYSDSTPKGKDRYYLSDEMLKAMEGQWNYYFIISAA